MSLSFKQGVSLKNIQPQTVLALILVERIYTAKTLRETVVTALWDDPKLKIHGPKSKHYLGLAADFRTKHLLDENQKVAVFNEVKRQLLPLGFDVVLESLGKDSEHLHVEFDLKVSI